MSLTSQFQHGLNCVLGVRHIEKRETVKAEWNEVESFCFLKPFQAVWNGSILVRLRSDLKPPARSSR
jgi:hypothetical protein